MFNQPPPNLDRTPPHDLDAETSALGSVLLQPAVLDEMADVVSPVDYHDPTNGMVYATLLDMHRDGEPIELATLRGRLKRDGYWVRIGEAVKLAELMTAVSVHHHWRHHAVTVRQHSQRRQVIHAAQDMMASGYDLSRTPEDVLGLAEDALASIQTGDYSAQPVTIHDALVDVMVEIDSILERQEGVGHLTGLHAFDTEIGGFFPGELAILAARPGQGKTSLALQIAAHQAAAGKRVYFATLEMSTVELALKRLCTEAAVSTQRVRACQISAEDQGRLAEAAQRVASKTLFLHDWPSIRVSDIHRAARRLKADIVYVDYLQIVTPPDGRKKRYEQVGDISLSLKLLARRMNIPVVACCQIGRQSEQGKDTRPRLSGLRESGNIEQDADMVLGLWRPKDGIKGREEYRSESWDAEAAVLKNRKGATTTIRLHWHAERTLFECHGEPLIF